MAYASGVAFSVVVFAAGAILDFAVKVQSTSVDWQTVGVILMLVGVAGLVLSLALSFSFNRGGSYRRSRRVSQDANGTVVEERGTY